MQPTLDFYFIKISSYYFFSILALFIGISLAHLRLETSLIEWEKKSRFLFWGVISFVGLTNIVFPQVSFSYFPARSSFFFLGFLFFIFFYFSQKFHLPFARILDLVTPSAFLALAMARLACLSEGCCFGFPCSEETYLALPYPPSSLAYQNVYLDKINLALLWKRHAPPEVHPWIYQTGGYEKIILSLDYYLPANIRKTLSGSLFSPPILLSSLYVGLFFLTDFLQKKNLKDGMTFLLGTIFFGVTTITVSLYRYDLVYSGKYFIQQNLSFLLICSCLGGVIFLQFFVSDRESSLL